MGHGQLCEGAIKKWRLFHHDSNGSVLGERTAGLSPACLNTGLRNLCACERLLTSAAVFYLSFFCCLPLSLSVFLASNWKRSWDGWRRLIWGLQTSYSGHARSDWHSPREGSIVSLQLHVLRQNQRECRWWIKLPTNQLESLCARPAALHLQQLSRTHSLQWWAWIGISIAI